MYLNTWSSVNTDILEKSRKCLARRSMSLGVGFHIPKSHAMCACSYTSTPDPCVCSSRGEHPVPAATAACCHVSHHDRIKLYIKETLPSRSWLRHSVFYHSNRKVTNSLPGSHLDVVSLQPWWSDARQVDGLVDSRIQLHNNGISI